MDQLVSFFGILILLGIAWLFSDQKKKIDLRVIVGGIGLQFVLGALILKTELGHSIFDVVKDVVNAVISLSDHGARFLFGDGFTEHFFAFKVLPTIIFASSLSAVLFYLGIMQRVVSAMAWVMKRVMNISGAESLVTAANVFIGQTEAPLFVKPYLSGMTRSEIMTMMVGGMATVAGGVLAAYVTFGVSAGHLLAASLMSAPAAIVVAKLMCPESEKSLTDGLEARALPSTDLNIFEAACNGAADGLKLSLNVGAMLIAFIGLVALVNMGLGTIGDIFGLELTLEKLLGICFRPLAFVLGVPWDETEVVGELLGTKIVINEFLSYMRLGEIIKAGNILSERSIVICTYALCGFANFSSIAIQIGGIGAICPERKKDFAALGFRSMVGGALAALITACVAGVLN